MKIIYSQFFPVAILILAVSACQVEEHEDYNEGAIKTSNFTANIDKEDLIGEWGLSKMESDTLVDLNDDGIWSINLLSETSCFDEMGVIFYEDGTFSTTNARLDFNYGENEDKFTCYIDRNDNGTWTVEEDDLVLNLEIDGTVYIDRKKIVQETSIFSFEISKFESDQYVNDPGDTQASEILILGLEYTKR